MAGLRSFGMSDIENDPQEAMSPMDRWVASLRGKGKMDPYNKYHQADINNMMSAIASGQLSEASVNKLADMNPKAAHLLYSAYGHWKQQSDAAMQMQQFFRNPTEARPGQPFVDTAGEFMGVGTPEGLKATPDIPAQPAVDNLEQALRHLRGRGQFEAAKKLLDSYGKQAEGYTLPPGNVRFGPDNKPVAFVPKDTTERDDKTFGNTKKLRDEFIGQSKPFKEVRDAYERIYEAGNKPSAAGDLALIFNYMKMLDPGSTVREGEFATAQNSAGIPERVQAMYNNVIRGERLTEQTRADFLGRAESLYGAGLRTQEQLEDVYRGLATRGGFNPNDVIVDYRVKGRRPTPAPANSPQTPANSPGGSAIPKGWSVREK